MAEEYDVQAIMNALRDKEEMDPDQHDGCYELMRETIGAYGKLDDFSALDYKDLNLVYLTTVGTWKQGIESKKKTVNDSHIMQEDKEYLTMLWDEVWDKASRGEYTNYEMGASGDRSIGMFGTGFFSFQRTTTDDHVQAFIKMCVDLLPMTDDNAMYDRAAKVLTSSFKGMKAASASMVLHCLKPNTFPVLNSNMGNRNIFEVLGVKLVKKDNIETYIDNCRKIKVFRDKNFSYKNYRIFDMAAWKVKEYVISHPTGLFESWEIVSEDVVRKSCDKSFFRDHGFGVPQDIRWFFHAEGLQSGRKLELVLVYDGFEYDAYIERENVSPARTRIFLNPSLEEEFAPFSDDGLQHILEFRHDGENKYIVEFMEAPGIRKVWLITWNKNNWHWENFAGKCEMTKAGDTFVESWACANSNPQIGDEVFLIKLGEQPRGIIGHGTVEQTVYEKPHYDTTKAAEGKTEKAIDVKFDRLINYDTEKIISQDELNEKCAEQHWSPQNSGIEIKHEVLPRLRALWEAVSQDDNKDDYWPSQEEYPVNISKDDWKRFIEEVEFPKHRGCMRVLACFIDIGGIASPKTLSDKYKGHPSVYVGSVVNTGRRAVDYFGMKPCPDGDVQRYFPVAFQGHPVKGDNGSTYEYRMRQELFEALKELDLSGIDLIYGKGETAKEMDKTIFNHNLILYGPPGTGKTYNSVNYAVAICDGRSIEDVKSDSYQDTLERFRELEEEERVVFTTFHQSYGYEEFIEGIKPVMSKNDMSGQLIYEIQDGIFKRLCKKAHGILSSENEEREGRESHNHKYKVWLVQLENSDRFSFKEKCFENEEIRFAIPNGGSWIRDAVNRMEKYDVVLSYSGNSFFVDGVGIIDDEESAMEKNGDDLQIFRHVKWMTTDEQIDMKKILHGESIFNSFNVKEIKNTRPIEVFALMPDQDDSYINDADDKLIDPTLPYVIIIDEINRGNISKIFGELITLIENTKRAGADEAMEAILPYSGESFSVPNNVYILGTMNTADRSIAIMDTALRRRFEFVEMMPDVEVLESLGIGTINIDETELNIAKMLTLINKRIEYLYDREHTIGHAFFTPLVEDVSIEVLSSIFEKKIIPLLQEYFYEDYEKIQLVLGDNDKENQYKFILDTEIEAKDVFKGNVDVDLPPKGYMIQHSAFKNIQSYKLIGRDL